MPAEAPASPSRAFEPTRTAASAAPPATPVTPPVFPPAGGPPGGGAHGGGAYAGPPGPAPQYGYGPPGNVPGGAPQYGYVPGGAPAPGSGQQPGTITAPLPAAGASPFWAADARRDPWRDPTSAPAWIAPPPPPPAGPGLPAPPGNPPGIRGGLGQVLLVAVVSALIAGLLGGGLGYVVAARTAGGGFSLGSPDGSTAEAANRAPNSVAGIVQRVQPSVVTVQVRTAEGRSTGSGFVIDGTGHVLTNNHVVASAAAGTAVPTVSFSDGSVASAKVVGRDPGSDVAVLKISKSGLKPVQFGNSDKIAIGDPVVAFGSPLGLSDTVTSGIVSAVDRPVKTGGTDGEEAAYMAAIQTDAAINPGNSGGPLVDGGGRVIGINSAIAAVPSPSGGKSGNIGIGFAIPINQAKRLAEDIIATGKTRTTVIGAVVDLTSETSSGAPLKEVPEGPAKAAGLQPGDIVTRFANRPIEDGVALVALVRKQPPGSKVPLQYTRRGQTVATTVTLGQK